MQPSACDFRGGSAANTGARGPCSGCLGQEQDRRVEGGKADLMEVDVPAGRSVGDAQLWSKERCSW